MKPGLPGREADAAAAAAVAGQVHLPPSCCCPCELLRISSLHPPSALRRTSRRALLSATKSHALRLTTGWYIAVGGVARSARPRFESSVTRALAGSRSGLSGGQSGGTLGGQRGRAWSGSVAPWRRQHRRLAGTPITCACACCCGWGCIDARSRCPIYMYTHICVCVRVFGNECVCVCLCV